jgi:DNA-directed RNA polymerase II subunit RPB2
MMGRGGCLPYGENAIVAIRMYGGNNQEDSVLVNGSSLRRGMFKTMYYRFV